MVRRKTDVFSGYTASVVKCKKKSSESTPKSKKTQKTRHCEARSNLIILVICILRLPHFVRNDENYFSEWTQQHNPATRSAWFGYT